MTKPSKYFIIKRIEELVKRKPNTRILDIGSGRSENFLPILKKYPKLTYVGIEPKDSDAKTAQKHTKKYPNVKIINRLAYDSLKEFNGYFDVVISLSVLEHVKQLEKFLRFSVAKAKRGGRIIHLYDLGHSLYPSSLKERVQVMLCNNVLTKWFMPETKFAAYVSEEKVKQILTKFGVRIDEVTRHNMQGHVSLLKKTQSAALRNAIIECESAVSSRANSLPTDFRERLLPSICIWGKRK